MEHRADLARRAQDVLARNRRGGWTCPSVPLYPHQWLWDSCFVAIGIATYDPARAGSELRALFRGQWSNGMLPHMNFAPDVRDVGSKRIWQSKRHPEAPRDVDTSCITQPPIAAIAVNRVGRALDDDARRELYAELYPKLVEHHRWLYRERDPERRGLVTLIHPWECGLDTTPPWMRALRRAPAPWWVRIALRLRLARVARWFRRDTKYLPHEERASDGDGLRMLAVAQDARHHGFEMRRMPPESVMIEDLAFNSFLVVANRELGGIAAELGEVIDPELQQSFRSTESALEELWDEESGQYYSRDTVLRELLTIPTIATFLPLWAGVVPPARQARLLALLEDGSGFWPRFPVPSVPTDDRHFDDDRYWKGPTWVNTNWAVIQGLREVGADDVAAELRERTLDLVEQSGFAEYFSALTGAGYGADEFSWTAALVLDLME
jgi:hypothetical protein